VDDSQSKPHDPGQQGGKGTTPIKRGKDPKKVWSSTEKTTPDGQPWGKVQRLKKGTENGRSRYEGSGWKPKRGKKNTETRGGYQTKRKQDSNVTATHSTRKRGEGNVTVRTRGGQGEGRNQAGWGARQEKAAKGKPSQKGGGAINDSSTDGSKGGGPTPSYQGKWPGHDQ